MMSGATPISRAWSVGQLDDDLIGDWSPLFDPHECHSDPIDFYSTRGTAFASLEVCDSTVPLLKLGCILRTRARCWRECGASEHELSQIRKSSHGRYKAHNGLGTTGMHLQTLHKSGSQ